MHQLIICITLIISTISAFGQSSGIIQYKEIIKMEFDIDVPEGIDLSSMLPESTTAYKELHFNKNQSVYLDSKTNQRSNQELESDDGSVKIMIKMNDKEEIYYTDLNASILTHQTSFMGKEFLIEEPFDKPKWKLTGEKVSYLGYECHKAELIFPPTEDDVDESIIVAWFAPSIQAQVGPRNYNKLPGAILMLSIDGDRYQYMAKEVNLNIDVSQKILKPSKGKGVSKAEYQQIIKAKKKEMKEMNGGEFIIKN